MNNQEVAIKLVSLRGEKSRQEVADAIGVSLSSVQMYENAERMPRDEIKIRIAAYFKTSVQDIFFAKQVTLSDN